MILKQRKDGANFLIKNITECECFVPLISENYHGASHTEQEFGMAIAMEKKDICSHL